MNEPDIMPISKIDPGELLLESVKNAQHLTPEMQRAIAKFLDIWSNRVMPPRIIKSKLFEKDLDL